MSFTSSVTDGFYTGRDDEKGKGLLANIWYSAILKKKFLCFSDVSKFEASTRNGLIKVQNMVGFMGDRISRLAQVEPTPKTVLAMKSLLTESLTAISGLEEQFKE